MLDKLWDFITSDDRVDRLITRIGLAVFLAAVYLIGTYLSVTLIVVILLIAGGGAAMATLMRNAEKRAQQEWKELINAEDDGETGYIKVLPGELDSPWEYKPVPQKSRVNLEKPTAKEAGDNV